MSSRRRPLHTCGVSIIRMARRGCDAGRGLIEPLGLNLRMVKIASFARTFVQVLLYFWLVVLSFVDDQIILSGEGIVERFFPPSRRVFDKIDELVQVVETLPGRFDCAVKKFPSLIRQFPCLDWALVHVISLLKLLITTLTCSEVTREKEIMVDISCDNRDKESESVLVTEAEHESTLVNESENQAKLSKAEDIKGSYRSQSETEQDETEIDCANVGLNGMKSTFKEVLEKGKTDVQSEVVSQEEGRKEDEKIYKKQDEIPKDDPIIEMFESGWLMR